MRKIYISLLFLLLSGLVFIFLPVGNIVKALFFIILSGLDFLYLKYVLKYYSLRSSFIMDNNEELPEADQPVEAISIPVFDEEAPLKKEIDFSQYDVCFNNLNSLIDSVNISESDIELDKLTNDFLPHITEASNNSVAIKGSISQIFTISDNLAKTTQTAFELAKDVQNSINYVSGKLEKAVSVTEELDNKSTEISKILDIMSNISSMVHILSINASIVSARAGIHGEGFKVVAKEIGNLAVNTDKSLKDIDEHVTDVQDAVARVAIEIKEAGRAIEAEAGELLNVAGALQGVLLSVEIINTVSGAAKDTTDDQARSFVALKESVDRLFEYLNGNFKDDHNQLDIYRDNMKKISINMNDLIYKDLGEDR